MLEMTFHMKFHKHCLRLKTLKINLKPPMQVFFLYFNLTYFDGTVS